MKLFSPSVSYILAARNSFNKSMLSSVVLKSSAHFIFFKIGYIKCLMLILNTLEAKKNLFRNFT